MRLSTAVALLAGLAGCGGDEPTRPPVVVITPEPVRAILAQTSFSHFEPDVWVSIELILSQKGALDITVDWTYPDTWMYVYLGNTDCSYPQLSSKTCPFFLASETKNPKPRVLVTGLLDPGKYYLVLYNVPYDPQTGIGGFGGESVSIQIGLTVYPFTNGPGGGVKIGRRQILTSPH